MAAGDVGINEWFASTSHPPLSSTIIEKGNFIDFLQMLPCWGKIEVSESDIEDLFRFISIASENPECFTQKNLVDVFLDIVHIPVAINQSVIAGDVIPDILQAIGKQSDSSSPCLTNFAEAGNHTRESMLCGAPIRSLNRS